MAGVEAPELFDAIADFETPAQLNRLAGAYAKAGLDVPAKLAEMVQS
eukprot:CAMPEP_0197400842 /NCGR_PEP_ID=MMETSP1165-20131217/17508_1 /TAXON_ID=284809 /ORGANISM="Chrysocystis fragilis, Strain CCMP3189" /LENGTH=46 /DNA_ID= /DNA_START= /DNA_END= /DNA_ORIENTATION=